MPNMRAWKASVEREIAAEGKRRSHREDPTRGVFTKTCERCGQTCPCRLRMVDNGYRWLCPKCSTEPVVLSMGSL